MVDYARPTAQWPDPSSDAEPLSPASFNYHAPTETYTLQAGRPEEHAGFALQEDGSYLLVPSIGTQTEATMTVIGDSFYIYP